MPAPSQYSPEASECRRTLALPWRAVACFQAWAIDVRPQSIGQVLSVQVGGLGHQRREYVDRPPRLTFLADTE